MNITLDELRDIKHRMPHGSITRIARELEMEEQTVRNYFGARDFSQGEIVDVHIEHGPGGGIVHLEDTRILEMAKQIIEEANRPVQPSLN